MDQVYSIIQCVLRLVEEISTSTEKTRVGNIPHNKRSFKKTELEDFDECVVRRVISLHEYDIRRKTNIKRYTVRRF